MRYQLIYGRRCMRAPPSSPLSALWGYLELPPIGWQLFILGNSKSDSTAFPLFLDTYATRLLAEPLRDYEYARPTNLVRVREYILLPLGRPDRELSRRGRRAGPLGAIPSRPYLHRAGLGRL